MTERNDIKRKVIHNIAIVSGDNETKIKESDKLESDLGITIDRRGALAPGFKKIAQKYRPQATVNKTECKKLKTVKECIDLVFQRATR